MATQDGSDVVSPEGLPGAEVTAVEGELIGQGTVVQVGDTPPQLCLGALAQSYPPQCGGPVIKKWDWETARHAQTASGVTWGTYAVTGTWDGTGFTLTRDPIPLSLYDAMPYQDPRPAEGYQGPASRQELERIQQELSTSTACTILSSSLEDGYLILTVIHDDGTLQTRLDADYGNGVVVVLSALRPLP